MADLRNGVAGTHSSNTSSDNPNHLNTNIESGGFDEKNDHHVTTTTKLPIQDEEEDEDMDALIDELESQDGHVEEEEEDVNPGTGRVVPEDQLQTDTRVGLTDSEVHARRKKYGSNQMKEEKENMILKFLGYFIGPIQFVMEVSSNFSRYPFCTFSVKSAPPWPALCLSLSLFWLQHRGPVDLGSGMQVALSRKLPLHTPL
jgi:H+-transporting ATPase